MLYDLNVKTSVPVNDNENVCDESRNSDRIRITAARLGHVEKLQ